MCVWGANSPSTTDVWERLQRSKLSAEQKQRLAKVVRVVQADDQVRFDIFVREGDEAAELMPRAIKRALASKRSRWHRSYWERVRARAQVTEHRRDVPRDPEVQPKQRRNGRHHGSGRARARGQGGHAARVEQAQQKRFWDSRCKVASWNVCGVQKKTLRLRDYLRGAQGVQVMALQETKLSDSKVRLHLDGYQVYESTAGLGVRGEHGLAVLVDARLDSELQGCSKWHQVIRVTMGGEDWIVINVYIPNKPPSGSGAATRRTDAEQAVEDAIRSCSVQGGRLIVLGDWNTGVSGMVSSWCRTRDLGLARVVPDGDVGTHHYTVNKSVAATSRIDHVLVPSETMHMVKRARVDAWFVESDHRPVRVWLPAEVSGDRRSPRAPQTVTVEGSIGRLPRVDRDRLRANASVVAAHACWRVEPGPVAAGEAPVQHEPDAHDCRSMAAAFLKAAGVALKPYVHSVSVTAGGGARLTRAAEVACRARAEARARWESAAGASDEVRSHLYDVFEKVAAEAKRQVRACHSMARRRKIQKGADLMVQRTGSAMSAWWKWSEHLRNDKGSDGGGLSAVRVRSLDNAEMVLRKPDEVMRAIHAHLEALLQDETGHSAGPKAREYWVQKLPGSGAAVLPFMDDEVSWGELNDALRVTRNGTAAGLDGVVPELLKAAAEDPKAPGFDSALPSTSLGSHLLALVRAMFDQGVPECMGSTELVMLYKKTGDRQMLDNYRGISLISLCVKLVTKVVEMRIQRAMRVANRRLDRRQAGFRSREECVAQTCALYEMLRGQTGLPMNPRGQAGSTAQGSTPPAASLEGEGEAASQQDMAGGGGGGPPVQPLPSSLGGGGVRKTFVMFIDFKKAYDLVPQEGMLRKLELFGIRGRVLKFVRSLYTVNTVSVRTQWGHTEAIQAKRGLRQGCPLSPFAFNVFIDDIFDGCTGVKVAHAPSGEIQSGVAFADDIAVLASTLEDMRANAAALTVQQRALEMRFGVKKCGLMGVGEEACQDLRGMEGQGGPLLLGGEAVPVVDSYLHLGTLLNHTLSTRVMIDARVAKGRRSLYSLRPALCAREVPVYMKVHLINACLLPVLCFGAELWGIDGRSQVIAQQILDEACSLAVGQRQVQRDTMLRELGLHSVRARTSGVVARAAVKYRTLETVIGDLCRRATTPRREQAWVKAAGQVLTTQSKVWLREFGGAVQGTAAEVVAAVATWTQDQAKIRVRQAVGHTEWTKACSGTVTARMYEAAQMVRTRAYVEMSVKWPQDAAAVQLLLAMRMGALAWAGDLARVPRYAAIRARLQEEKCPCCGVAEMESAEHFLLRCGAWQGQRTRYLQPLLEEMAATERFSGEDGSGEVRTAQFYALIGGVGLAAVDRWAAVAAAPPANPGAGGERAAAAGGTRGWWLRGSEQAGSGQSLPPYIRVARFIAEARRERWKRIKAMLQEAAGADDAGEASTGESSGSEGDDQEVASVAGE